jgi:hypothetical protein
MKRTILILALLLAVAGCSQYKLVQPEQRVAIDDLYSVKPGMQWSSINQNGVEVWTIDGPLLESMRFINNVEDGEALFKTGEADKRPRFSKNMSEVEVVEFVVDAIKFAGGKQVQAKQVQPYSFGGKKGFRFGLDFVDGDGLEQSGIVVGQLGQKKLHIVVFVAARSHYFQAYREEVERILASIQFRGEG